MNRRIIASLRILSTTFLFAWIFAGKAGGADIEAVLKTMPAELPISIIITDVKKFDQSLQDFIKRIDPDAYAGSIIDQLNRELGMEKWIDFSKPMGLAQATLNGPDSPLLWVTVPDFAEKIKTIEGATREDDIWRIPVSESKTIYAQPHDSFIIIATDKENLARARVKEKTLAQVLQNRNELVRTHDLFLHLNFDAFRDKALQGTAQLAQMAPMLAMLIAQNTGSAPMTYTGAISTLSESAQSLIRQLSYVDLAININDKAADLTMAAGFRDGPIKQYLSKQKPAGVSLLSDIKAQSFVLAAGYHFPGKESPFFDYLFNKMITTSAMSPLGISNSSDNNQNPTRIALETTRDFYRKVEGENAVLSTSSNGFTMTGNYIGRNTKELFEEAKKYIVHARSFLQMCSSGATYQSIGTRKIANTTVEEFAMTLDPNDPRTARAIQLFGAEPRIALGVVGDRVRYYNGSAQQMVRAFADRIDQPLSSSKFVKEALAALPEKRNVIILLDIASALPVIGPMFGLEVTNGEIPPGPPIAISATLSGEPARLDIHIPVRAIERIVTYLAPKEEPM